MLTHIDLNGNTVTSIVPSLFTSQIITAKFPLGPTVLIYY